MNIFTKRAIGFAVLAYVASFITGIVTAMVLGVDLASTDVPNSLWYVGMLMAVIIMKIVTMLYFKPKKLKPSFQSGLELGIVTVVVGFVLDMLIIIPTYNQGGSEIISTYYTTPFFWMTLALVAVTPAATGWFLAKK